MLTPPPVFTGAAPIDALIAGDLEATMSALGRLARPATAMALFALAPLVRIARNALIEALSADHVSAARAGPGLAAWPSLALIVSALVFGPASDALRDVCDVRAKP